MKKLLFFLLLILCSCTKEERDCYSCQTLIIQSIRNSSFIKPDTVFYYTTHCDLTSKECIIMKNINTFSTISIFNKDTIDTKYIMKCKPSFKL